MRRKSEIERLLSDDHLTDIDLDDHSSALACSDTSPHSEDGSASGLVAQKKTRDINLESAEVCSRCVFDRKRYTM